MMDNSARILVLGDSGVGKTCFVHLVCHRSALKSSTWTVGCAVDVKMLNESSVEFRDVGGKAAHENSRRLFYKDIDGVILVHDLTNKKSCDNLRKWYSEFFGTVDSSKLAPKSLLSDIDPERTVGHASLVPVLVVGTKFDQSTETRGRRIAIAEDAGADSIFINCLDAAAFIGSENDIKVNGFLRNVIECQARRNTMSPKNVNSIHRSGGEVVFGRRPTPATGSPPSIRPQFPRVGGRNVLSSK